MSLFFLLLGFAASCVAGVFIARRSREWFFLPPVVYVLFGLYGQKIYASIFPAHNWIGLLRPFLAGRGVSLYPDPATGPVFSSMYGPLSALALYPATLVASPEGAMRLAATLNIAYYLLPVFLIHASASFPEKVKSPRMWASFFIFALFPFCISSLKAAALRIHPDAPALGFSVLACFFLCRRMPRHRMVLYAAASLFAAFALWTKHVTLPLFFALTFWVWRRDGLKEVAQFVLFFALWNALLGVLFIKTYGFGNLWFHLVSVPSHQPWRGSSPAAGLWHSALKLFSQVLWILVLALPFLLDRVLTRNRSQKLPLEVTQAPSASTLLFLVALFMAPVAIVANTKLGGSSNTLSYVTYFLLAGVTLGYQERESARRWTRGICVFLSLLLFVILVFRFVIPKKEVHYFQAGYEYAQRHPGDTYFPRLTLIHLLAEGKVYHEASGVLDRQWAKFPVTADHLAAYVPERWMLMGFVEKTEDNRELFIREGVSGQTTDSELPGFTLYRRK